MKFDNDTAFWGALICSSVWAAVPGGLGHIVMATLWLVAAGAIGLSGARRESQP